MAKRLGWTQVAQGLRVKEVITANTNSDEKDNKLGVWVEGYVDKGCKTNVFIPKMALKAFGEFKPHVANGIPSYAPKSKSTTKRPSKFDEGDPFKDCKPYAGRLYFLKVAGTGIDKKIGKAGGGSSTKKVKNVYMRFPAIMDHAAVSYFILNGFPTIPESWTAYRGRTVTKDAKVTLDKLGSKYSSKMEPA